MQGFLGIIVILMLAWGLSENRRRVHWKLVLTGLVLQGILALVMLKFPYVSELISSLNSIVMALETATKAGSTFMFGYLSGGPSPFDVTNPAGNFIIAFQVLPIILVVSALSALFYHYGILQKAIRFLSWCLKKTMGVDGATAFGVGASIFFGIIEAPLLVKPYLNKMTRSGLFTLITASMATVAGSVMVLYASLLDKVIANAAGQILIASLISAPAAIVIAKMMIPGRRENLEVDEDVLKTDTKSPFEAIVNGTIEGINMVIHIAGILIVIFAFIAIINMLLGFIPTDSPLTIQQVAGWIFWPFLWLIGIPMGDLSIASQLMGTKTLMNEFVAYSQMAGAELSDRSKIILTYAMCGFANFGSLGILIGGLGSILPDRKEEVIQLGLRGILSGTLATMMTGAFISLFV